MKNLSRYFTEAGRDANERFMNANGFSDDMNYMDDDFSFTDDDGFHATGPAQGGSNPTSQPYILNVVNTTTNDIQNVTILGAFTNLASSAPAYGNTTGISITMGIANVTYTEFLYQSMVKPFAIGLTYITSTSDAQVLETLTLTMKDVNGNVSSKVLTPVVDPYQQQSNRIAFKYAYTIDGYTNIVISSILAKQSSQNGNVKLYFYPTETVSTARVLNGSKAARVYANPNVVQGTKLQLTKSDVRALGGR